MGLKVGAAFLDDAEQHTVRELFAMISARDDGLLSIPETKDVLNVLGLNSLQASSTRLPAEKQQGTNGFLSVDNALQALLGPSPALYTQFDLLNAFSLFANPEGPSSCITSKALKDALVKHSGNKMLSTDVDVLLANTALASQGSVDYQDIISKFFST